MRIVTETRRRIRVIARSCARAMSAIKIPLNHTSIHLQYKLKKLRGDDKRLKIHKLKHYTERKTKKTVGVVHEGS